MPDARFAPEGSWRTGFSVLKPYRAIWTGVALFPWLEGNFRYTEIDGVPGGLGPDFGDFKDKSFDGKLRLLPERRWWPQVALGYQDVAGGTGVFSAPYVVASKRIGAFDFTLGGGKDRIDGAFGGVRWRAPCWWRVVAWPRRPTPP
mgnify:FL=1